MKLHCPICNALTTWEENPHRPFCSDRCRLIDLGQWVTESYRVPGEPVETQADSDGDGGQDQ
jgi:hypothetical protein